MEQQPDPVTEEPGVTKLDQLEAALDRDEAWSRADQAWLLAELRKAWARLEDSEAWIPADPSRIG